MDYYPDEFKAWPTTQHWIVGAVTAAMFFVSVLLHELRHWVIALRYRTPVRSITLFIFGGVSQIEAEPPSAAGEVWIAVAGPVSVRPWLCPSVCCNLSCPASPRLYPWLDWSNRKKTASTASRWRSTRTSLSELLNCVVPMAADCIGGEVAGLAAALEPGQVLMLENLRFHKQEEEVTHASQ